MALVFLKLGGSLITDKSRPYTARPRKIASLASEIADALQGNPELQLVLGHGSGSFGHEAANRYQTRQGVIGSDAWHGFAEVWYQASELNRRVVDSLRQEGLPAVTLSPAASVTAHDGKVFIWDTYPIITALSNQLLPVIHGDVAFDDIRGGTILSTEDLFVHLAATLYPKRILLAGMEAGVWADFPSRKRLIRQITPADLADQALDLRGAAGTDVTGGMRSKVQEMLALAEKIPGLEIQIFSGEKPGNLKRALQGDVFGTLLRC